MAFGQLLSDRAANPPDAAAFAADVQPRVAAAVEWSGGGLDTLVFAGGIGENAQVIRARICKELSFLGIELNESRNAETAAVISTDASRVTVRVIRTDEELMIARSVCRTLGFRPGQ
jgi:acetate kinase